jgi:glycerate dehydrogenase
VTTPVESIVHPVEIVVLDGYTLNPGDNPWDEVARLGALTVHDRTSVEQIAARARGAEIVLTNKTPLSAATLAELPRLRLIRVLATGHDIVDVAAAAERGIVVSNVPEYGTDSVAQHVFALLLELCHQVARHDAAVREGEWCRSPDFSFWKSAPIELAGLVMGIVGFGRIGRRVAELAGAFGMEVIVSSHAGRSAPGAPAGSGVQRVGLDELVARADVVTLHCPLTDDNAKFVGRELLARMKPGAYLINTARGGLVDEEALAEALRAGRIAGAAVDVVSAEPMRPGNPLLGAPNCIITPHMAWASLAARRRLMSATAANVRAFLAGRPQNVVNGR